MTATYMVLQLMLRLVVDLVVFMLGWVKMDQFSRAKNLWVIVDTFLCHIPACAPYFVLVHHLQPIGNVINGIWCT